MQPQLFRQQPASGFSLLEVILAIVIASTVAAIGISHLRKPASDAHQHSCDAHREMLQGLADRYVAEQGLPASRDLRELQGATYYETAVPRCPATAQSYELLGPLVECPAHRSTRN